MPNSRDTVVPNLSNRRPLDSVRKLLTKAAMVKIRESCWSCPLQSAEGDGGQRPITVEVRSPDALRDTTYPYLYITIQGIQTLLAKATFEVAL